MKQVKPANMRKTALLLSYDEITGAVPLSNTKLNVLSILFGVLIACVLVAGFAL